MDAVLIPARNEGPRIAGVLRRVQRTWPGACFVVDGGSTDDTAAIARAHGATVLPQVGRGYAGALATGWGELRRLGATRVVQLDADGQHPPEAIPALLAALDRADLVFARRTGGRPLPRRIGHVALSAAVWASTGLRLHDVTSGFWAGGPAAVELLGGPGWHRTADVHVRVRAARGGLRLAEVPVAMAEREGGRSMHDGLHGLRNFLLSLRSVVG